MPRGRPHPVARSKKGLQFHLTDPQGDSKKKSPPRFAPSRNLAAKSVRCLRLCAKRDAIYCRGLLIALPGHTNARSAAIESSDP
jgi:hypothetical protein